MFPPESSTLLKGLPAEKLYDGTISLLKTWTPFDMGRTGAVILEYMGVMVPVEWCGGNLTRMGDMVVDELMRKRELKPRYQSILRELIGHGGYHGTHELAAYLCRFAVAEVFAQAACRRPR